jgi:FixJ family two-component response regulator
LSEQPIEILTPKQREAWELREQGLTHREIAKQLSVSVAAVHRRIKGANERLSDPEGWLTDRRNRGMADRERCRKLGDAQSLAATRPEAAALVVRRMSDPLSPTLKSVAREAGVSEPTVARIREIMDSHWLDTKLKIEEGKTPHLLDLCSSRARQILESVTQGDLKSASLKDKAIAAAIMIEKRQLLSGEPTQRVTFETRGKLNELVQRLVEEGKRRGMEFDVTPLATTLPSGAE